MLRTVPVVEGSDGRRRYAFIATQAAGMRAPCAFVCPIHQLLSVCQVFALVSCGLPWNRNSAAATLLATLCNGQTSCLQQCNKNTSLHIGEQAAIVPGRYKGSMMRWNRSRRES